MTIVSYKVAQNFNLSSVQSILLLRTVRTLLSYKNIAHSGTDKVCTRQFLEDSGLNKQKYQVDACTLRFLSVILTDFNHIRAFCPSLFLKNLMQTQQKLFHQSGGCMN